MTGKPLPFLTMIVRPAKGLDGVLNPTPDEALINYEQGRFPKNAAISFSGKKFENVLELEGKEARIYFDISGQISHHHY